MAMLAWQDEAGGFGFTRDCVLGMTLDEMDDLIDFATRRRKERNAAIENANARNKPKR